jgi:hypothetical protein
LNSEASSINSKAAGGHARRQNYSVTLQFWLCDYFSCVQLRPSAIRQSSYDRICKARSPNNDQMLPMSIQFQRGSRFRTFQAMRHICCCWDCALATSNQYLLVVWSCHAKLIAQIEQEWPKECRAESDIIYGVDQSTVASRNTPAEPIGCTEQKSTVQPVFQTTPSVQPPTERGKSRSTRACSGPTERGN